MTVSRRLAGLALALALAGTVGCRGRSTPSPTPAPTPSPGAPITVTGSERLGWDLDLAADSAVQEYSFGVYVDGTRQALDDVRCDAAGTTDLPCTAAFPSLTPGQHTLELVAVLDGEESARSTALVVTRVAGRTGAADPGTGSTARAVEVVLGGLTSPTDLARLPDGRLVVTERAGRVLLVEPDGAGGQATPALVLDEVDSAAGGGLTAVAVSPDFARTGHVYLAFTTRDRHGAPTVRVVRAREAGGTLGEIAAVSELEAPAVGAWAAVRFGPDGKLYVAITDADPGAAVAGRARGTVLRLEADGTTPADNEAAQAVRTRVEGRPSGLAWSASGAPWVAAWQPGGAAYLSTAGRDAFVLPDGALPGALAMQSAPSGAAVLLLARVDGAGIDRFAVGADDTLTALAPLVDDRHGRVRCVLPAPDGTVWFCTDNAADGGSAGDGVLRTLPGPGAGGAAAEDGVPASRRRPWGVAP